MKGVAQIISVLSLTLLSSCATESDEAYQKVKTVSIANSPSELALQMRDMDAKLFEIEGEYEETGVWPDSHFEFPSIIDLKPTTESMMSDIVISFSPIFDKILNEYNKSPSKEGRDQIVQACLACHYQSCPGPIVRIEKHIFATDY